VNLFLDSSVLLAACASTTGASSEVNRRAETNGWSLMVTAYVIEEVETNLPALPIEAATRWQRLRPTLKLVDDVFTIDRPAVFGPAKDRPILFSALAWADLLLTLDRGDFGELMSQPFYGLRILTPGDFLMLERTAGRLR
jgi:predicted nucleic acid-binding protein